MTDLNQRERDGQHKESARSRTDKVCVVYVDRHSQISSSFFCLFLPGPHNHSVFIFSSSLSTPYLLRLFLSPFVSLYLLYCTQLKVDFFAIVQLTAHHNERNFLMNTLGL